MSRRAAWWFVIALAIVLIASGCAPIVDGPGALFLPRFEGAAVEAQPVAAPTVPQHPWLAANGRNSMHNDAYASDAYAGPGPLGRNTVVTSAMFGVNECASLTFDRNGRLLGLCVDIAGPRLQLMDPHTLRILAKQGLPGRKLRAGVNPFEDLCGAYYYLDRDDRAVVATTDKRIQIFRISWAIELLKTIDLASRVPGKDCLLALMPDWSGRIWFATGAGRVGQVEPDTGRAQVVELQGERITNSLAVDETGGVYVVTDHALYRFDSGPRITWRQPYDRGRHRKPGQLSQGSGTTPTVLGNGLVAITDNAEPQMHVQAYDRKNGTRMCNVPVFRPGRSATENSLVAVGNSVIVENNYGYTGPLSTLYGRTTEPGVSKVDLDHCRVEWTSDEIAPSCVAKMSLQAGLLYVYAKPARTNAAAWYFTAIDVRTGRTAFRVLTGTGVQWNNHYAAITLGPDGAAYVATLGGMVRIADS
jgi:hypothetical protein